VVEVVDVVSVGSVVEVVDVVSVGSVVEVVDVVSVGSPGSDPIAGIGSAMIVRIATTAIASALRA
jgi:hypothetical protein